MATIKHYKVVAALPSTLVADSIYLVRVGTGFDLYVTNSSGTIVAYPANYQAGSANLSALSGLTGGANKAPYFTAAGAMAVYDLTVFGRSFAAAADAAAGRTLLGLGTAATRAATTSPTDTTSERLWRTNDLVKQTGPKDTTAGRVMLTSAGGWMDVAPVLTGNDYNNDSEYCGIVKNDNNTPAVNYPPQISANAPMAAMNVRFNGSYGWQLGVQTLGPSPSDAGLRAFLRQEVGGTWGNWAELWHSLNFNPATKANLAGANFSGQVVMPNASVIRGSSAGAANVATLHFQDSSGARTGYVGDSGSGTHVALASDNGPVLLMSQGTSALSATNTGVTLTGNVVIDGETVDNTDSGWIALTFTNGWFANGTFGTPAYRRIGKLVFLRGVIQAATANNNKVAFTLPTGYRPASQWIFSVAGGAFLAADGIVNIGADGQAVANDVTAPATCNVNLTGCVLVVA